MLQDPSALVLEIFRQDSLLKMSVFLQQEASSTLRQYSQCPVSFPEVKKLSQEILLFLNRTNKKGLIDAELLVGLRKTGQILWDQLLTKTAKDKIKATQSSFLLLSIDEELIDIPWEFLYDGNDFLCLKFNLGRLVRTKRQISAPQYRDISRVLKMLVLANPTGDLHSAYLEGLQIKNQFDRKRNEVRIDFKSTQIDTLYLKKNLHDYDIVHFAGHCEYEALAPQDTGWALSDGKFTAQDIIAMGETVSLPTLVFSNACQSAKVEQDTIDLDCQEKAYSLASAFLFSGVRHYIGTMRKIEDTVSLDFAREFYARLMKGLAVGEALRLARLKLIRERGMLAIHWASYILYGDPNFILFRTNLKEGSAYVKRDFALAKRHTKSALGLLAGFLLLFFCVYLYLRVPAVNPNTYILFSKADRSSHKGNHQEVIALGERLIARDPLFLKAYPLLADTYRKLGRTQEALQYYFDYVFYSQKVDDKKHLADAYIGIGWIYQGQGDYPRAYDFYLKGLSLAREGKDTLHEAVALRKLAVWYIDKENYDKALELLLQSSEINRDKAHISEYRYNLACDYFDIGLVFADKDDLENAKDFYKKSQAIFEKMKLKEEFSDYYFNLGEIYMLERDYQKALGCYLKGLKIDRQHDNRQNIASDYNMIGELYLEIGDLKQAQSHFEQALLVSRGINAPLELAAAYYNLGLLYKQKGQKNRCREYLRQAQEIYQHIDTPDYQIIKQEFAELQ